MLRQSSQTSLKRFRLTLIMIATWVPINNRVHHLLHKRFGLRTRLPARIRRSETLHEHSRPGDNYKIFCWHIAHLEQMQIVALSLNIQFTGFKELHPHFKEHIAKLTQNKDALNVIMIINSTRIRTRTRTRTRTSSFRLYHDNGC